MLGLRDTLYSALGGLAFALALLGLLTLAGQIPW